MRPVGKSDQLVVQTATISSRRHARRIQRRQLEKWVLRHLGEIDHERRVARIALKLFDLTSPLHALGRPHRRVLRWAAIVHDVGRCIDNTSHPQRGARMLLRDARLNLRRSERRTLAYLTRYHRGKVPEAGCDKILRRTDDHDCLRIVLALLRVADTLDSRSQQTPRLSFLMLGRRLQITCHLSDPSPKACRIYSRRKKFRLLEELLDCRVHVRIMQSSELRRAA